ncbi:hypothetical protein GQ600_2262 [Phytophthora cactorum]|nr:hypothetical protein GQ600_2262 [Phytophthora cactorum]
MTLETVLFLQYNHSFWDASSVAQAVDNNRKKTLRSLAVSKTDMSSYIIRG